MRNQIIILSTLLFFSVTFSSAQITFQKTFAILGNDFGNSVQATSDGGYIIAGLANIYGNTEEDLFIIKTDMNGDTMWTKHFIGANEDWGRSVQQSTDGGYIITGGTYTFGAGYRDVYLIKLDSNGNTMWINTFGGTGGDAGYSVHQTMDGGFIIVGNTDMLGAGNPDVYLIKTDINGNSVWTKTFGGTNTDAGNSVQQTMDSCYIITGTTLSFGAGGIDVYLIKTDANGDLLWTKTFGGSGNDWGNSVHQTIDGGFIVTGWTNSFGSGGYDIYLIKTNFDGDTLWTKALGGISEDKGYSIQQTSDGGYIIVGYTYSFGSGNADVYLVKTDVNGNISWTKTFGQAGFEQGYFTQQLPDGSYIISGHTNSFNTTGYAVYLIKTDSVGNVGCNEDSTLTITSSTATQVTIPATIATSPATIANTQVTSVSNGAFVNMLCPTDINEITKHNLFHIYPNPSVGSFIISFERNILHGQIEMFNILSENVFMESVLNESKKVITVLNIPSGIYFIKVFDGEIYHSQKIIIKQD